VKELSRQLVQQQKDHNHKVEEMESNMKYFESKHKESMRSINEMRMQISEYKTQLRDRGLQEKESQNQIRGLLDEVENNLGNVKRLEEEVVVLKRMLEDKKDSSLSSLEKRVKELTIENMELSKNLDTAHSFSKKLEACVVERE